jgi:hypothetical protein
MPFDQREERMASDPETYYITDHHRDYEWMLVRLSKAHPDALRDLLWLVYRAATRLSKRGPPVCMPGLLAAISSRRYNTGPFAPPKRIHVQ